MHILFTTERTQAPSTELNLANFRRLGGQEGVEFTAYDDDWAGYEVILFMGYDPQVKAARKVNPGAKIGIVDIRPPLLEQARGADFLLANGPEMAAFGARLFNNIFEYPIYPEVSPRQTAPTSDERIIVCYHGNRAHAVAMFPHVTRALEALSNEVPLELRLIYNMKQSSRIPDTFLPRGNIQVRHVQWHPEVYSRELAEAHIGIVPNLTPMHQTDKALRLTAPRFEDFGAHPSEWLLRFKPTSNPGRILAFAQHGIPVVADIFPSSAQVLRHGETGYLAFDAFGWYQALRTLCLEAKVRHRMGDSLKSHFEAHWNIERVTARFIRFLREIMPRHEPPHALADTQNRFDQTDRKGLLRSMCKKFTS